MKIFVKENQNDSNQKVLGFENSFNNTITESLQSNEILVTSRSCLHNAKVESSVDGVPEGILKHIVLVNIQKGKPNLLIVH